MPKFYSYFLLLSMWILGTELATAQNTVVTPASAVSNICVGGGYTTLGTINIAETNLGDFNSGTGLTYIISVPANFEFNTGVTPTVTASSGTGVTNIVASAPTTTTFTFTFDVSGGSTSAGPVDAINITNIQVRAINSASIGDLTGGSAAMIGNSAGDKVHCSLTSLPVTSITTQPVNNNVCATLTNQTIFTIAASGSSLSYSWERDNLNSGDGTGFNQISVAAPGSYGGYNTSILTNTINNLNQNGFLFRCVVSGACGSPVTSNTMTLSVASAAAVTSNPGDQSVCTGGTATFSVTGTNSTSYQWQESIGGGAFNAISNGGVYSGATSANLIITGAPVGMNGNTYRCVVSNSVCTTLVPSNSALLTVSGGPVITSQPVDQNACVGDNTSFTVTASGFGLVFTWERNNGAWGNPPGGFYSISTVGSTSTITLNPGAATMQDGYMFRCTVQGSCGSNVVSNAATIQVSDPASATTPGNQTVCIGGTATFSVTGTNTTSYQWQERIGAGAFNDISNGGIYSGATSATLSITGATAGMSSNTYRCVVSNSVCTTLVPSNSASLTVNAGPSVSSQPTNNTKCVGTNATFSVTASNTTIYRWEEGISGVYSTINNGGIYGGATAATLTLTGVTAGMNGRTYRCQLTNASCSSPTATNAATLTVETGPVITSQPANTTACVGATPSFSVTATGAGLSYQWERDRGDGSGFGTPPSPNYSGQNTNTITIVNNPPGVTTYNNGYLLKCIITGTCGSPVTSSIATLTVYSGATLSYFGLDATYCTNSPVDELTGFPAGGVFSGPGVGVTDPVTGKATFNPLTAGAGPKTINYTLGCSVPHSTTVNDTTNIAYTSPANANPSFFTTDPPVDLVVETAPTPTGPIASGTFSGSGVSGTKFYPTLVAAGGPYPILFTYTNPSGCTSKVTKGITITSPGRNIPVLQAGSPFCQNSAVVLLDETTVQGGSPVFTPGFYEFEGYSGTGISSLGGNSYQFNPTVAGSYVINYNVRVLTLVFTGGLIFSFEWRTSVYASQTVTVNTVTPIDFNLPTSACNTGSAIDMTPFPGVLAGLSPNVLTKFTIQSPASPPGGLLSGANNTILNPSAVSTTTLFTVRYTFYGSACPTILDKQINVFTKPPVPTVFTPNVYWQSQNEEYCLGVNRKLLGATDDVTGLNPDYSSTYTWTNNVNTTLSNYYYLFPVLSDNAPGTYHYFVTRSVGGCVSDPLDVVMKINDKATVNAGSAQTICEGNTVTLAGASTKVSSGAPLGATWYSPTSDAFSPSASNLGAVYTPTASDISAGSVDLVLRSDDPDGAGGPCPIDTQVVKITIKQAAVVDAGPNMTYCSNSTVVLSGQPLGSATSITWSGGTNPIPNPTLLTTTYNATTAEKSNSTIIFTATSNDPVGPCLAVSDQVSITINDQANVDAGIDQRLCRSKATTIFGLNGISELSNSNSVLNATWSGGLGTFSNSSSLTTTYTPDPAEIPADGSFNQQVTLYLNSADPDGVGPCLAMMDSIVLTVNPLPDVQSVIVPSNSFCKTPSASSFLLSAIVSTNYGGSGIFSDTSTAVPGVSGSFFLPSAAGVGQHRIYHIYTDGNTCKNYHDTLINVYGIPRPKFTITEYCATKPTYFNPSASDVVDFSNSNLDLNSTITSYSWTYKPFTPVVTITTPVITNYTYDKTLDPSARQDITVKLKLETNHGCIAEKDSVLTIGNIPPANFSWSKICPADPATLYKDISLFPSAEVNKYSWDFNDLSPIQSGPGMIGGNPNTTDKNPAHKMAQGTGAYNVKFKILSNIGCADSMTHKVNILDEYKPTPTDPYTKNFASTDGFWSVDGQNPSWQWGSANKANISTGARNVWVTNTVGTYNVSEKSYLNGPCLNFTDLARPMISLKINSATQNQIAGAVLQSSSDGGTTWNVVGAMGSGLNWYDNFGVLGNPGNQTVNQFAWTGTYPDWKISKINLNNLAGNTSVRLRIAFGSGQDTLSLKDGFALDSIWVGSRDKILLAENFTNSSTASVIASDTKLNTTVNSRWRDLVAIHYHTGFPGSDPMNLRNQADPSSRVLHYGVPKVPYTVFDGNYDYGTVLDTIDVDRRSLDPARFKIKMATNITNTDVNVMARLIATDSISNNFVMHAAVIERYVTAVTGSNSQTNFEWVATRMLPNAGGTYFDQNFNKNDSVDVNLQWNYFPTEVYDPTKLGVVVFIQDVTTKEVYQAAYKLGTASITSGLKNQLLAGKQLFVYPNPSNNATNILFEEASDEDLEYTLQNELGQVVDKGVVLKGTTEFPINTSGIPSGMYVVKVGNDKDGVAFKKIIVTH